MATISSTTGAFVAVSDRRRKENIRKKDISNNEKDYLERILDLKLYSCTMKED